MAITVPGSLPTPLRIAAGVVGEAVDHLGNLPAELPALGMAVAGRAVRTSLRVRQRLAELAVRGDDLLAPLLTRHEEQPSWATFDEDEVPVSAPTPAAESAGDAEVPVAPKKTRRPAGGSAGGSAARATRPAATRAGTNGTGTTQPTTNPAGTSPATTTPARTTRPTTTHATTNPAGANPAGTTRPATKPATRKPRSGAARTPPVDAAEEPSGNPLTLPFTAFKSALSELPADATELLLRQEEADLARAPYLTALINRLTTLRQAP